MTSTADTAPVHEPVDARTKRNVGALFLAQAILWTQLLIQIGFSPLAGAMLASNPAFATLPITVMVVASMFASAPASLLMGRIGRKAGFLLGIAAGAIGGALSATAIVINSFPLLLVAAAFTGIYQSHQHLFRFAATDTAPEHFKPKAVAWVLAGGLVAAFTGPWVAATFKDALAPFALAGAFAAVVGVNLIGAIPILALDIPKPPRRAKGAPRSGRPLREILAQPVTQVAILCGMITYALMSLVMTSTSTAMVGCGLSVDQAGSVIGAHVFAMFAPSFFTGGLINRFGHIRIMAVGLALLAGCGVVALSGVEIERFYLALILLGVGWNFGFIGATSLLASSHAPEERSEIQGFNDFCVFGLVAVASASSGALLHFFGWSAVNLAMVPLLCLAGAALLWLSIKRPTLEA